MVFINLTLDLKCTGHDQHYDHISRITVRIKRRLYKGEVLMNDQMLDRLFSDAYGMMNFEITFAGVKNWFLLAGVEMDDTTLFRTLFVPEQIEEAVQAETLQMIVYRYEDMFFQINRCDQASIEDQNIIMNTNDPIHQLLLQMMNKRVLTGTENAMLDLYLILQQDQNKRSPNYPSLHGLFKN